MAILVERSGKVVYDDHVPDGALTVIRHRKVWDEAFPFVRTAETFFDPTRCHYVRDIFRLEWDGLWRYVYSHTEGEERSIAESIAMVGGAAGVMARRAAMVGCPEPYAR